MANIDKSKSSTDVINVEIRGYIKKTGQYVSDEEADAFSVIIMKNGRLCDSAYFRTLDEAKKYASKFVI
jgi:hypothetical protein